MSIAVKAIKSGLWLQLSRLVQLGGNLAISTVLARLLLPTDFGLVGIVTLYASLTAKFTIIGLTLAIIQKKDITQSQLSSIYWLNMGFGFLAAVVVGVTSPYIAGFYNKPELVPLILLYALTFIISPFFQIHRRLLEKELQFGKISVIEVIANLGSGMLGIILALFGFGVYSIIAQTVSLTMFYMVLTRCNIKWKPDYHFTFRETKSLIVFSLKMKGARLANFLARNIDFLILSKLFDITLFGYYSLAYRVMYFPIRRFSNVFSDILFPVFSKIQSNEKKIKTGYLKSIQIVAMAAIPISSILAVLSKPLVSVFLGEKWLQVSDILFVLSVAGLLQSIEVISDSIFPALNSPQTLLIIEILRIIVTGIAVVIGGIFGLLEVALALLAARLLLFVINFGILQRFIHIKFIEVGRKLLGPIFSGLIMFLCLSLLANRETITLPSLILTLTAGILSYFAVLTMCNFGDLKYLYLKLRVKNSV